MTRRECREVTLKLLFSRLDNEKFDFETTLNEILVDYVVKDDEIEFVKQLFDTTMENQEEIINKISSNLKDYEWSRIYKIDKCLLMLGMSELDYLKTPSKVVINEIVELAKQFSTDKSPKFINGILANFVGA